MMKSKPEEVTSEHVIPLKKGTRRSFIGYSGITLASAAVLVAGCKKDDPDPVVTADFSFVTDKLKVTFTNKSTAGKSYSWNFGDGSPASTEKDPVHTYAAGGAFKVKLTVDGTKTKEQTVTVTPNTVNLGSGNVGILNYAYALEQLEAAFYTALVADPAFSTTFPDATERRLLTDIRDHEIAHREFLKMALGSGAITGLTPKLTGVDLKSRSTVLATAKTFEDLGVMAYNGAGKLFTNDDAGNGYLLIAGKIVSVEARHAAWIADKISNGTFSDTTDANGLDKAMEPPAVLTAAQPFIVEIIDGSQLPTA